MSNKIPPEIIDKLVLLLVLLIVMLFYLVGGKMDYQDAIFSEKIYIQNVCEGVHPDYKEWKIKCEDRK